MNDEMSEHAFFEDQALFAAAEGASQAVLLLLGQQVEPSVAQLIAAYTLVAFSAAGGCQPPASQNLEGLVLDLHTLSASPSGTEQGWLL